MTNSSGLGGALRSSLGNAISVKACPELPLLVATLTVGVMLLSACGPVTAPQFAGTWAGTPKAVVTQGGTVKDAPVNGNAVELTAEGSGTLVSLIWAADCPLKFVQGNDPMKFALLPVTCPASSAGTPSAATTGTLNFTSTTTLSMDVSGTLGPASAPTATWTITFAGTKK